MTIDLKLAIDDMRARQLALVTLILTTDQKALALYRLYVTLAVAAVATAAGAYAQDGDFYRFAMWALLSTSAVLGIGCYCCSMAIATADVVLPGRGAEFWAWALEVEATNEQILKAYTDQLAPALVMNRTLNERTALWLSRAVWAGILAPVIGVVFGLNGTWS